MKEGNRKRKICLKLINGVENKAVNSSMFGKVEIFHPASLKPDYRDFMLFYRYGKKIYVIIFIRSHNS